MVRKMEGIEHMINIDKQLSKRIKRQQNKKIFEYRGYAVTLVSNILLFPVLVIMYPMFVIMAEYDLIKEWFYKKFHTGENIAKAVNKMFPIVCDIDKDTGDLSFYKDDNSWRYFCKWYHPILKGFCLRYGNEMTLYVNNHLQIEGYKKTEEEDNYSVFVVFQKIK